MLQFIKEKWKCTLILDWCVTNPQYGVENIPEISDEISDEIPVFQLLMAMTLNVQYTSYHTIMYYGTSS